MREIREVRKIRGEWAATGTGQATTIRVATLLESYLDSLETIIRDELPPHGSRTSDALRRFDLIDALDSVAVARDELTVP